MKLKKDKLRRRFPLPATPSMEQTSQIATILWEWGLRDLIPVCSPYGQWSKSLHLRSVPSHHFCFLCLGTDIFYWCILHFTSAVCYATNNVLLKPFTELFISSISYFSSSIWRSWLLLGALFGKNIHHFLLVDRLLSILFLR